MGVAQKAQCEERKNRISSNPEGLAIGDGLSNDLLNLFLRSIAIFNEFKASMAGARI